MTSESELEKTQLEIARLQLAQEGHKLEQIQQRRKVMGGLGQGAAVVGGAAMKGGSAILRYVGRWLLWAAFTEVCILLAAAWFADKYPVEGGWTYSVGHWLGYTAKPHILAVFLSASVTAFVPLDLRYERSVSNTMVAPLLITAAVFAAWYFL